MSALEPIDVAAVMGKLDTLAVGLDTLSKELGEAERLRAQAEDDYEDFIDNFVAGLYEQSGNKRLPGEDVRRSLAHKAMPAETLGQYRTLTRRAERLRRRIADVKVQVDANRSILSALKLEMEASR
jgi:hypothetical protein